MLMDVPDALCGRRIVVRPYQPQDTPAILAGVSASRADLEHRLRSKKGFESPDDARRVVARSRARWILREDFIAGIFAPPAGAFCGGISLHPVDWDHGKFEIGYWLCVEARGKGYATEAVRLMTRLAFAHLGAQRVEIVVECDNAPSCRVAERADFLREGTLRRHLAAPDGTLRDVHVYSLIREDCERLPAGQVPGEGGISGAGAWRQPEPSGAAPPPAPGAGAMRLHDPDILFLDSAADLAPEQLDGFFSGWRRPVTAGEHLRLLRASEAVVVAVDPAASRVGRVCRRAQRRRPVRPHHPARSPARVSRARDWADHGAQAPGEAGRPVRGGRRLRPGPAAVLRAVRSDTRGGCSPAVVRKRLGRCPGCPGYVIPV